MNEFMKIAIEEALIGLKEKSGGPFGAVIVRNGEIIAKAHNEVIKNNDPTAHAEILAIRKASAKLKSFDLSDCDIYAVSEPCPMCFSAIHWAKMKKLYYGCTIKDAAEIGFNDELIYDIIKGTSQKKQVELIQIDREECLKPFKEWKLKTDKTKY